MTLIRDKDGKYKDIVVFLEARMLGYFTVAADPTNPPAGQVAETQPIFPYNFGPNFPVGAASELTHEGEQTRGLRRGQTPPPRTIDVGIRIYYPSLITAGTLGPDSGFDDGRERARNICRDVYESWREKFYEDEELETMVEGIIMGQAEWGDHDRISDPFYMPNLSETILWVHSAPVQFIL